WVAALAGATLPITAWAQTPGQTPPPSSTTPPADGTTTAPPAATTPPADGSATTTATPAANPPATTPPPAETPPAAPPPPRPLPWRGSLLFATLSANLNTFAPGLQQTQNATVDSYLAFRPRLYVHPMLQLRGGINLYYEFTNSDSTTTNNEPQASD